MMPVKGSKKLLQDLDEARKEIDQLLKDLEKN